MAAEFQFELAGEVTVAVTLSQAEGGTVLCDLVLPQQFAGSNEISLSVVGSAVLLRKIVKLPTVPVDTDTGEDIKLSVLLSHTETHLQLKDVARRNLFLDCITMTGDVLELSGAIPDCAHELNEIEFDDFMDDDDIVLIAERDPDEDTRIDATQTSKLIAAQASAGIAQYYEDDIEDSFIMRCGDALQ